jgi:ribosomal protein S15P/S13E
MQDEGARYTGQSGGGQVQEKVQGTAQDLSGQAKQVGGQVQDRLKDQIDTRSTQAGEQVASITDGIRKMGEHFESQGQQTAGRLTEQAVQRTDQFASYLRRSDADTILRDVEDFGRRQPWMLVVGGIALGFAASRFLKASSSRRYQGTASARLEPTYAPGPTSETLAEAAPVRTYEERGSGVYVTPAAGPNSSL